MAIHLISVHQKLPDWVEAGFSFYNKRLPPELRLRCHDISAGKRGKQDLQRVIQDEEKAILAAVPKAGYQIALDRGGKQLNTVSFS